MKGQLRFDEFMNISEEKPQQEINGCVEPRTPMVDPCYYCLCNSCINNAESVTVTPDELSDDWRPCFFCDICRNFDEESPDVMERIECSEYVIDNYHAALNRKKLRIVR